MGRKAHINDSDSGLLKISAQVSGIALLILASTLIGLGAGWWLDGKLGTSPWLAFSLTIVGLASGLYESYKLLLRAAREIDK